MVRPLRRGCHDPVTRAEAEQQEQSLPVATEKRQAMRRREDEHIEAVALFPPAPSSLHEGGSSALPQKGLGKKTKPKQKTNHDTEGQMSSPIFQSWITSAGSSWAILLQFGFDTSSALLSVLSCGGETGRAGKWVSPSQGSWKSKPFAAEGPTPGARVSPPSFYWLEVELSQRRDPKDDIGPAPMGPTWPALWATAFLRQVQRLGRQLSAPGWGTLGKAGGSFQLFSPASHLDWG